MPDRNSNPVLVLFRDDLRLDDNRALSAAASTGRPIIPLFVLDESSPGMRRLGGARRWWLHHSLTALAGALAGRGSRLTLRGGAMDDVVADVARATGAAAVLWNRRYHAPAREADAAMKARLRASGVEAESFDGFLLHEPFRLKTGAGGPFKVFTPFWRAFLASGEPRDPADAPDSLAAPAAWPDSLTPNDLRLLPTAPDWSGGLGEAWTPGEEAARRDLVRFVDHALNGYADNRDRPDLPATSRLSPRLAHGELSPHRIWSAIAAARADPRDKQKFLAELGWREFSWHLLFHWPDLANVNFNRAFDSFTWRNDRAGLRAWQTGNTGYGLVDAGMQQLWTTGWMHNRVRMVAASFLIKHLLIDWRVGEEWFWDTLVDADPASNAASWQWVAGSGADAAPYFRIFNPILQAEKFDPHGAYRRRFAPSSSTIAPVVDHDFARRRALDALESMRRND